jgi:hypothetical protein
MLQHHKPISDQPGYYANAHTFCFSFGAMAEGSSSNRAPRWLVRAGSRACKLKALEAVRVRRLAPHSHKRTHTPKLSYTSCQLELEPGKQCERKGPPSLDWRRVPRAHRGTAEHAAFDGHGPTAHRARSHVGSGRTPNVS